MNDNLRNETAVAVIKGSLAFTVESLEGLRSGLRHLVDLLPSSDIEKEPDLSLDDLDESMELRSVILCVLEDNLRPAIEGLRAAAGPRPTDREGDAPGSR